MQSTVGIRDLRDALTRHLARVKRGGQIVVTDRGHPVALLLPYGRGRRSNKAHRLEAILSSRHVAPAEKKFLLSPPLARGRGRLLSRLVSEGRR